MAKQTFTTGQVLTAGQMTSLQQTAMGGGAATAKTASYVLVAADAGTVVAMNSASATTVTVNTGLFAAGDSVQIQNLGAGVLTVTAGTATVSTSAVLTLKQYDGGTLYFVSASAAIFFSSDAADSPLTTKGDLYTYSTTNDRLAVGAVNGMGLQVDSTAATGMKWDYNKVVQIVAAETGSSVTVTTNTLTDTNLTATITPKSASNKILVFVSQNGVLKDTNNTSATIVLLRAGSAIKFLVVYGGYTNSTATIGGLSITGAYLDSPATTSSVTYKTQFKSEANSSSVIVQHGGAVSTIVLMEVTP